MQQRSISLDREDSEDVDSLEEPLKSKAKRRESESRQGTRETNLKTSSVRTLPPRLIDVMILADQRKLIVLVI